MHPSQVTTITAELNAHGIGRSYVTHDPKNMDEVLQFINNTKEFLAEHPTHAVATITMRNAEGKKRIYTLYKEQEKRKLPKRDEEYTSSYEQFFCR